MGPSSSGLWSWGTPSFSARISFAGLLCPRLLCPVLLLSGLLIVGSTIVGCGPERNSAVQETDEYSFDDVTAQIAAEEAAITEDDE